MLKISFSSGRKFWMIWAWCLASLSISESLEIYWTICSHQSLSKSNSLKSGWEKKVARSNFEWLHRVDTDLSLLSIHYRPRAGYLRGGVATGFDGFGLAVALVVTASSLSTTIARQRGSKASRAKEMAEMQEGGTCATQQESIHLLILWQLLSWCYISSRK